METDVGLSNIYSEAPHSGQNYFWPDFFHIREHNVICLSNALERYNWNGILLDNDVSSAYTNLTNVLHWFISQFVPVKQVTITDNCPSFVTPLIKSLLRKRNKLMRKNKLEKAVALGEKIGKMISIRDAVSN